MSRIHTLSDELISCIAAGEVVERPASVIKELLENSLDAKATEIDVYCYEGGKKEIRVQDNGQGIHPKDLSLAIKSHATSKIETLHDLERIGSLGFRGEALSAISGIAKLNIKSRYFKEDIAYEITVEANKLIGAIKPVAYSEGTAISVKNIFFNLPVRKKFLKSKESEFLAIENLIKILALSHFSVRFRLFHEEKLILDFLPAQTGEEKQLRLKKILGKAFLENSVLIHASSPNHLSLSGWISLPTLHRGQTDLQYFYLNGRAIRDKLILHAIRLAYETLLPAGRHPLYCLYLTCPLEEVDINIHPNKQEVRFRQARWIHQFIYMKIKEILSLEKNERERDSKEYGIVHDAYLNEEQLEQEKQPVDEFTALNKNIESTSSDIRKNFKLLNLTHRQYAIVEHETGITIVDLLGIYAFFQKEKIREAIQQKQFAKKLLLIPAIFSVNLLQLEWLNEVTELFEEIGITIEPFSQNQMIIRELPLYLEHFQIEFWVRSLFEKNEFHLLFKQEDIIKSISWLQAQNWLEQISKQKNHKEVFSVTLSDFLEEQIIPTFEKKFPFYQPIFLTQFESAC